MRRLGQFCSAFVFMFMLSHIASSEAYGRVVASKAVGSCVPIYSLELTGPRAVRTGEDVKFEIKVRNLSDCPITNLTVTYFFPDIATVEPGNFTPSPNFITGLNVTRRFSWPYLEAPPRGVATIVQTVKITATQSMNMVSRACAISVNGPPFCVDWRYAVNPPVPFESDGRLVN